MPKLVLRFIPQLICLLVVSFSYPSFAQDTEHDRGRLSDGRAFRTDSDGTQLVDYIAELEQGLAELNRKVIGLEDENSSVRAELERVKAGHPDQVAEKDLLKGGDPSPQFSVQSKFKSPVKFEEQNCPPQNECLCPESSCPESKCPENVCPENTCPEIEKVESISEEKVAELMATQASEFSEKQLLLRNQVAQLERELTKARSERDHFLTVAQKATLDAQAKEREKAQLEMRASVKPDLETSRHQAVDLIKSRLKKELQLLTSRKDERDLLFAKYVVARNGLTLKPSALKAKSGHELNQIDELLNNAETVRELTFIRTDLEEIRRQMSDDLALIERMSKLSN